MSQVQARCVPHSPEIPPPLSRSLEPPVNIESHEIFPKSGEKCAKVKTVSVWYVIFDTGEFFRLLKKYNTILPSP